LVFYSLRTFADPAVFETRFLPRTSDIVVEGALPDIARPEAANTEISAVPKVASWTSVFNGRSFSFLASAAALGILAWEYRRRQVASATGQLATGTPARSLLDDSVFGAIPPAALMIAAIPLTLMGLMIVETFAFGHAQHWLFPTYIGLFEIWTALAALGLVALGAFWGPRALQKVGLGVFGLLAIFLFVSFIATLVGWSGEWYSLVNTGTAAT